MRILKSNFELALQLAIEVQGERDKQGGIGESCFVAGLKEILNASMNGERITVEAT